MSSLELGHLHPLSRWDPLETLVLMREPVEWWVLGLALETLWWVLGLALVTLWWVLGLVLAPLEW